MGGSQRNHILDRHSPVPLYQQLSDILAQQIRTGLLKPGDGLPSENELINQFGVSRYVVRQTINNLGRQGLIYTEHGRGSFVSQTRIDKPLDILQSYHEGMRRSGINPDVRIMQKSIVVPPEEIASQLELLPEEQAFYLERVAYVDDSPVNILISYISLRSLDQNYLMGFQGGSLYQYLKQECGVCLRRSHSYIEVVFANEFESRALNVSRGAVLLQILGIVYAEDEKPIEYSRVVYPGALFRFHFDSFASGQAGDTQRYLVS
jgi:GntR family transcriptional regulator